MATIRFTNNGKTQRISSAFLRNAVNPHGEPFALSEFVTIGRDPENTLVLEDLFVSARHARIEQKPIGFVVKDLRSRNGTYVNNSQIFETLLEEGDIVRCGKTELIFSSQQTTELPRRRLTSKNPKFGEQLSRLPQIASLDIPVLILGPSGAGKELIAQAVHELSARSEGPFVSVNCGALTESLVESELFGHVRGSFTGANSDRKGAFESARGGTLFLDEIGDLPLTLQPKLLRALENQEIRPVGCDRTVKTDIRIVAATHQGLWQKVQNGQFRLDLYYRLQGVQFHPPALKERLEDFEDLLFVFAREQKVRFSHAAICGLKNHCWPGNIRELKNTVLRARALFGGRTIEPTDLEQLITVIPRDARRSLPDTENPSFSLKSFEKELILSRLTANQGNQRKTAEDLGIPKSTLHDRIRRYGLEKDSCPRLENEVRLKENAVHTQ